MNEDKKNAVIISITDDTSEIIELANTLDYNSEKIFIQHRQKPDVRGYIGEGKIKEIKEFLETNEEKIELIIINDKLKPSQWFLLEKELNIQVYDRVRLILAIFEEHAERKEAKLQVKLAQLQYERSFVKELIHRSRSGEHPGLMALGEYKVDDYYEMIKKQTKKIKEELNNIRINREFRRKHRHKSGFYLVSLAGYTNAGKSSLLNYVSNENVKVEGKLFSTLSTTTRKINQKKIPILLTDTVGFIKNLPAIIIDAFHSTLEEIQLADLILLVIDISEGEEKIKEKLITSLDELKEIGTNAPIIFVFNKSDLISEEQKESKINFLTERKIIDDKKIVTISIKNKKNIKKLLDIVNESLPQKTKLDISLPLNEETQSFVSWVYKKTNVIDISYDEKICISIECNPLIANQIISKSIKLDGVIKK